MIMVCTFVTVGI